MKSKIEQRLKIIKLLIIIRYLYELQKAKKAFKKPPSQELPSLRGSLLGLKLSKPSAFADSCFKKSFWLYASMLRLYESHELERAGTAARLHEVTGAQL